MSIAKIEGFENIKYVADAMIAGYNQNNTGDISNRAYLTIPSSIGVPYGGDAFYASVTPNVNQPYNLYSSTSYQLVTAIDKAKTVEARGLTVSYKVYNYGSNAFGHLGTNGDVIGYSVNNLASRSTPNNYTRMGSTITYDATNNEIKEQQYVKAMGTFSTNYSAISLFESDNYFFTHNGASATANTTRYFRVFSKGANKNSEARMDDMFSTGTTPVTINSTNIMYLTNEDSNKQLRVFDAVAGGSAATTRVINRYLIDYTDTIDGVLPLKATNTLSCTVGSFTSTITATNVLGIADIEETNSTIIHSRDSTGVVVAKHPFTGSSSTVPFFRINYEAGDVIQSDRVTVDQMIYCNNAYYLVGATVADVTLGYYKIFVLKCDTIGDDAASSGKFKKVYESPEHPVAGGNYRISVRSIGDNKFGIAYNASIGAFDTTTDTCDMSALVGNFAPTTILKSGDAYYVRTSTTTRSPTYQKTTDFKTFIGFSDAFVNTGGIGGVMSMGLLGGFATASTSTQVMTVNRVAFYGGVVSARSRWVYGSLATYSTNAFNNTANITLTSISGNNELDTSKYQQGVPDVGDYATIEYRVYAASPANEYGNYYVQMYIDGIQQFPQYSFFGIQNDASELRFLAPRMSGITIDDLAISYGSTDMIGEVRVLPKVLNEDKEIEWTAVPDTIPNYQAVSQAYSDYMKCGLTGKDYTYIETGEITAKDTYGMAALSKDGYRPAAMQVSAVVEKLFATTPEIGIGITNGTETVESLSYPIMGDANQPVTITTVFNTDSKGEVWDDTKINATDVIIDKRA